MKHNEVPFAGANKEVWVAEVEGSKLRDVSHWYFCSAKCTEGREGGRKGKKERERERGKKEKREGGGQKGKREGGNVRTHVPTEF